MRKSIIICLVLFSLFSLAGCSNSDLEELRYEKEIENKKVEAVVSEYNTNINFFYSVEDEISNYLFSDEIDMYDFKNYNQVFYDNNNLIELYFVKDKIFAYIDKYMLNPENIQNSLVCFPFMDEKTGGVNVYYRIPIESYVLLELTVKIQEGQIISVEYKIEK